VAGSAPKIGARKGATIKGQPALYNILITKDFSNKSSCENKKSEDSSTSSFCLARLDNQPSKINLLKPTILPDGVMVAQLILVQFVLVRIQVGQPIKQNRLFAQNKAKRRVLEGKKRGSQFQGAVPQ
jgi:hypothetical protein